MKSEKIWTEKVAIIYRTRFGGNIYVKLCSSRLTSGGSERWETVEFGELTARMTLFTS